MGRGYVELNRGTGEWSRKIRKATEHRRLRHASHQAMRDAARMRGFGADDLDATPALLSAGYQASPHSTAS